MRAFIHGGLETHEAVVSPVQAQVGAIGAAVAVTVVHPDLLEIVAAEPVADGADSPGRGAHRVARRVIGTHVAGVGVILCLEEAGVIHLAHKV